MRKVMIDAPNIINNINNIFSDVGSIDFNSPEFQATLFPLKIILGIFSLIFFIAIIFVLYKTQWLRFMFLEKVVEFFTFCPYETRKMPKAWIGILARVEKGLESEYKLAVVEADEMLEDVLKKMEYTGKTLEDRLGQVSPTIISNIEDIREVHKIRHKVVYDPDYELTLDEIKRILEVYEKAFRELQLF